jgi:hypothetical protein
MQSAAQSLSPRREIKRIKFTPDEDDSILRLTSQYGTGDWTFIAHKLGGGRTKRQVRERWQSYLNPELAREYTEEEDWLLQSLFSQIGPKWATIAVALRNKSGISVRNRFRMLRSNKYKESILMCKRRLVAQQQPAPPALVFDWSTDWQSGAWDSDCDLSV